VDRVFSLVDEDGSGEIEWPEYVGHWTPQLKHAVLVELTQPVLSWSTGCRFLTAMAALEKGRPEIKNRFAFQVYDLGRFHHCFSSTPLPALLCMATVV